MSPLSVIANREERLGPIALQLILVFLSSIGVAFLPYSNLLMILIFPAGIGWYLNGNEIHRLILIPLWIIISLVIGAAIY